MSGSLASSITYVLFSPLEVVKTRLQLQRTESTRVPYKGILDAFTRIVKEEGWLALYRGILPALFLTSHGAVQFVVYEKLKELRPPSTDAGRSEALVYGGVSKLAAATATYPYQVVKTRVQAGLSPSATAAVRQIVRGGGLAARYMGFGAAVALVARH